MNSRPSFFSMIPPVVKNLIIINFILWLACELVPVILAQSGISFDLRDYLGMHYWASQKFNPLQLITYIFMHGGFTHVLFNMFTLFIFGCMLENYWGSKRFLFYYLFAGFGAGIVQQIFWAIDVQPLINHINEAINAGTVEPLLSHQIELSKYFRINNLESFDISTIVSMKTMLQDGLLTVGASGSVFGILLAYGWMFPENKVMLLFIPIPIPARIFVTLYAVAELFLGVARMPGDNVAHFAHLGGVLFGALLILYWKKKEKRSK